MTRYQAAIAAATVLFGLPAIAFPSPSFWTSYSHRRAAQLECNQASFASVLPPEATIETVAAVPEGGSYGGGADDVAYPINPTRLPALCAVTVKVQSSASSSYRFGLFLPTAWNGKFLTIGNGGFAGGINWLDMGPGPHYGMATVSTDMGHNSTMEMTAWALNNSEARTDWGWRATHGSVVLGKQLTEAYYGGTNISYSFYNGCSTGGRQGLRELQQFPDSFDGALIGAPAWWTTHLNNYLTQVGLYNLPETDPKHISTALMAVLADEVVRQCDGADGVIDGIVSSPELCTFSFTPLFCNDTNTNPDSCLNPAQVQTAQNVYRDVYSPNGTFLYSGLTLSSEDQWFILLGGAEPSPFGLGYDRDFLCNDPSWNWTDFNLSRTIALAEKLHPGDATAAQFDLSAFKQRGAKLMLYHGLADGLVPTRGSEYYYNETIAAFNGSRAAVDDFFRLFLVPGMQHCWSTPVGAPWSIGGSFQAGVMGPEYWSVPGFEGSKRHDALLALADWVERGEAVESVVATAWRSPMNASSGVLRQRPLCAWPAKAVWDGVGDQDQADSWRCAG
ncbi:Tannase/feruloyl esterase [Cercophora scortea]|uniref:Carboxylic ester hydrolase n=1 Tax=Cercophora scortea TaxID=314031 RepID=A0AAE0M5A6_9PEZI|nr:Tannase/feruloyl esterase [Cercophora scortea]